MTTWRFSEPQTKKLGPDTYMPRQHDPGRALWRGLKSLLTAVEAPRTTAGKPARWLAPGVVRWAEVIAPWLHGRGLDQIRVRAVGLVYGSNNSVVDEMIDDRLELPVALLEDDTGQLKQLAVDVVDATETAVGALRDLSARLAQAAGADSQTLDGPRARAGEHAYAELDGPFRRWLASLSQDEPPEVAAGRWRVESRQILYCVGSELVDAAGPAAWVGRPVKNLGGRQALLDAGLAWRWFGAALDRVLPNDSRTSEAVPS
jgi:CRISPR system Cascade subunit CasA